MLREARANRAVCWKTLAAVCAALFTIYNRIRTAVS
jgi:hypothetical protein